MLLFAAVAFAWIAPLIWLMRLAEQEIEAAQKLHVDLPPRNAKHAQEFEPAKLLLVDPLERSESETKQLPRAA